MSTTEAPTWAGGWLIEARRCPSPNANERPAGACVSLIVVHAISLPPDAFGGPHIEQLFCNSLDPSAHPYFATVAPLRVSAHFVLRRDGTLLQFVDVDRRAWHAGESAWQGRANCNDYSVGIELEGSESTPFTEAQYAQLARLCELLRQRYPIEAVAGHQHVAPGRKWDPGRQFDWTRLQAALGWSPTCFPAPT